VGESEAIILQSWELRTGERQSGNITHMELAYRQNRSHKLTKKASGYCLIDEVLYQRSISSPLLKCMSSKESTYVLREMHEGV
jgi:hypothetical protein